MTVLNVSVKLNPVMTNEQLLHANKLENSINELDSAIAQIETFGLSRVRLESETEFILDTDNSYICAELLGEMMINALKREYTRLKKEFKNL